MSSASLHPFVTMGAMTGIVLQFPTAFSLGDADGSSATDLRSWLATLERVELVELVARAADADQELREHLVRRRTASTASAPIDLAGHREAIADRFGAGGDASAPCCWVHEAHEVIDEVEALLSGGHATDVLEFCEFAVNCLETNAPDIFDADEELVGLAARLGELHLRACLVAAPEPVGLAQRLFAAETHHDLGAFADAADRYADVLGAVGLAEYRRLADSAWSGQKRRSDIARAIDRYRLEPIMRALDRAARGG
jgi:hypothetical protein